MTTNNENAKPVAGQRQATAAATQAQLEASAAEQEAIRAKAAAEKAAQEQADAEARAKEQVKIADAASKSAEGTTTLKQLRVLVMRDEQTQVPAYVFEHELPILYQLHGGDERVSVIETDTVEVAGFNPATELERLKRKYKNRDQANVVAMVYRDPSELASKAGVRYSGASAAKPPRSTVTKGKKKVIGRKR